MDKVNKFSFDLMTPKLAALFLYLLECDTPILEAVDLHISEAIQSLFKEKGQPYTLLHHRTASIVWSNNHILWWNARFSCYIWKNLEYD